MGRLPHLDLRRAGVADVHRRSALHLHLRSPDDILAREAQPRPARQRTAQERDRALRAPGRPGAAEQHALAVIVVTVRGTQPGSDPPMLCLMRWRLQLRSERGLALVMAVGVSAVLLIAGTTAVAYSTSNQAEANQSRQRQGAAALAEAGISNALAVLNLPTNNAMLQRTLPACTTNGAKYSDSTAQRTSVTTWSQSPDGSTAWCGTYVSSLQSWYLTGIGTTRNPNSGNGKVSAVSEATVTVTPNVKQPLGNPVWNYIYAGHIGSTCDQNLNNNVSGSSRMYVAGNLCIGNNAVVSQTSLTVGGNLVLA